MSMLGQMAKGLIRLAKMAGFYPDGQLFLDFTNQASKSLTRSSV